MPASTESSAWSWQSASTLAGRLRKSGAEWKGRQGGDKVSERGEVASVLSRAAAVLRPRSLNKTGEALRHGRGRALWPTVERVKAAPLSPQGRKLASGGPGSPACGHTDDAASSGETIGPGPSDSEAEDSGSLGGGKGNSLPLSTQCRALASPDCSTPSAHSGELSPCESALPPWLSDGPASPETHSDLDVLPPRRHTFVPGARRSATEAPLCDDERARRDSSGSEDAGCSLALASDGSLMSDELLCALTAHSLPGGPPPGRGRQSPSPAEARSQAAPVQADAQCTLHVRTRSKWDCDDDARPEAAAPPEARVFRLNMTPKSCEEDAAQPATPPAAPLESPLRRVACEAAAEACGGAPVDEGLQRVVALCQPHDAFSSSERCDIFACQELCTEEIDDAEVAAVLPEEGAPRDGDDSASEEEGDSEHAVKWAPAFAAPARRAGGASPFSRPAAARPAGVERGPGQTRLAVAAPRPPGSTRSHKERQLGKLRQWQHHVRQQSRLHRLCSIPAMLCAIPEADSLPGQRPPPRSGPSSASSSTSGLSCGGYSTSSDEDGGPATPPADTDSRGEPRACAHAAVPQGLPAERCQAAMPVAPPPPPPPPPAKKLPAKSRDDRVPEMLEALVVGAEWVRPWV